MEHLRDHEELGDEPLYYEADHGSVYCSGSENDYYEAPEHRRLRIEMKAVQFLNGQVPYLLSSRLEGPFDRESWTNPWRSRRAERKLASSRPSGKPSVKTLEAARANVTDKATDDLASTQRTNLYPLPSPETTNPPSVRKNPYLENSEYEWIKEWRDVVQVGGTSSSADPVRTSQHNAEPSVPSTKKRPANDEWLRKNEQKKRRSTKSMSPSPMESPSRTAAQARKRRISRQSSIFAEHASRSSTHSNNVSATENAIFSSFVVSKIAKKFETAPNLPRMTDKSLSAKRLLNDHSNSSEDELSMPSTTPSGRSGRSSAGRSSSPNCSPSQRRKQTKWAKKPRHQGDDELANSGLITLELKEACETSEGQEASGTTKEIRNRAFVQSQQDSSFCFRQLKDKSPAEADLQLCMEEHDLIKPASTLPPTQTLISERTNHRSHPNIPADGQGIEGKTDPERMQIDTHDLDPTSHKICGESDAQETSQIRQRAEPRSAEHITSENAVPINRQCAATKPDALPRKTGDTCRTSPRVDVDSSNADWTTYVNTQDFSVAFTRPSQEKQSHDGTRPLVQEAEHESDSDWATVASTDEPLISDCTSAEAAQIDQYLPVVQQKPYDRSESEWSTFLFSADQSVTTSKQPESPFLRRETMNDIVECDSDSDWSTCMSVSSQLDFDDTGNTSHEPSLVDPITPHTKPLQSSPTSVVEIPAEDPQGNSRLREISPMDDSHDTAVEALATETNENLEGLDSSNGNKHDSSALVRTPNQAHKETVGDPGLIEKQNSAQSVTSIDPCSETPSKANPTELRDPTDVETFFDSKTPVRIVDVQPADSSSNVNTGVTNTQQAQCQTPWSKDSTLGAQLGDASVEVSHAINVTQAGSEAPQEQSPWFKEQMELPLKEVPSTRGHKGDGDGNLSNLCSLAGQAIAVCSTPQTPWVGEKLPSPDFSLSVKRFSDFMKLSPTKKRTSSSSSILRSSNFGSNILFKRSAPSRSQRRVTFAPLPGQETIEGVELGTQEDGQVYVEEDVSYFDSQGNKTTTVHITRPTVRAASPPPRDVNTSEAGQIPDHDHKFAKHFEAMSKRKKNPIQRAPRLLPADSPHANSSQDIGAMAEAFIQASQTRRKGLELNAVPLDSPVRVPLSDNDVSSGQATPLRSASFVEDQENVAPVVVDDVSAVLDNLNDFLDNTWGVNSVNLSMDEGQDADPSVQLARQTASQRSREKSTPSQDVDSMWGLDVNVWAD